MELYTYQSLDFDIANDKPNLSKSPYYNEENIHFKTAYDFLFKKINRRDNIWCYGSPVTFSSENDNSQDFEPCRLWHLKVPDKYITAVDVRIWDFAINGWYYVTNEAFEQFVPDISDQSSSDQFDEFVANFYKKDPRNSYNKLVKPFKTADQFSDHFLIPAPIKKQWIIRTFVIKPEKHISILRKNK